MLTQSSLRPAIRESVNRFLVSSGLAPITPPTPQHDIDWKEQRYIDLTELSNRRPLTDDEADELDELGADLNEDAGLAAWVECERRGNF